MIRHGAWIAQKPLDREASEATRLAIAAISHQPMSIRVIEGHAMAINQKMPDLIFW